jgi:SLT domain-containing protein
LVALIATYAAVGFLVVPRLVRSNAQDFVSKIYGRKAEMAEIWFKARAQSIQEALLGGGQVDPGRVFIITAGAKPAVAAEARVRMELSLK